MTQCPQCKKQYTPYLEVHEPYGMRRWRSGELIQVAFPKAKPFEREQLITGLCSDACWDKYLGAT